MAETKLVKFVGRHDGTKGDINIYDLPAFVYRKPVELPADVADRIKEDFGEWFEVSDKPASDAGKDTAAKADSAPADAGKAS